MKAARKKIGALFGEIGDSVTDFGEHTRWRTNYRKSCECNTLFIFSAHGIPRAFSSRTSLKKYLWLLLFFVCLSAFFFEAYHIVQRFFRHDIIVGVELKFENIPFPSVTVCNNNPYKNSLARQLGPVRDTVRYGFCFLCCYLLSKKSVEKRLKIKIKNQFFNCL